MALKMQIIVTFLLPYVTISLAAPQRSSIQASPAPFTLCKSKFFGCTGVYDGSGRCVCGSEVRTLLHKGTFNDRDCTNLREEVSELPIAMDSCFHYPLENGTVLPIKVTCLKDQIGASFKMYSSPNCQSEPIAEEKVYPNRCVFGGLESYVSGANTWVIDNTCSDSPLSRSRSVPERPTIAGAAIQTDSLSTLVTAVKAADLVDTLNGDGSFTVFAPNNDAFAKIPQNALSNLLQPENVDKLRSVLLRHVLPNIRLAADIPFGTNEVQAANGEMVKITKSREGVIIESSAGKARVIATDVLASNGVVHVVDTVF